MINWVLALDDWLTNPHEFGHLLGFNKLSKGHGEWIKIFLQAYKNKDIEVLQAHRGSYKTTCGIVALVLLYMIYPEMRILITRKTITMASDVVKSVQKIFETNSAVILYMESRWGIKSAVTNVWSSEKCNFAFKKKVTVNPSLSAAGVGGSITGSHFDYIWADDIVTVEDRYSPAERRNTKIYWRELNNVIEPSGVRMLTSTPWHEDDLHAEIPSEYFEDRKFPFGTVELPEEDIKSIADRKNKLPISEWCANYELRHVADRDTIGAFPLDDTWGCDYSVAFIDLSFSDKTDTDSMAVAIIGVRMDGRLIFTGENYQRSISDVQTRRNMILFLNKFTPVESVIESQLSDSSVFFIDALKETENELRVKIKNYWSVKHQYRNKHERIMAAIASNRDKMFMLSGTQPEFALNVARYSKGVEHEDSIDALAGALDTLATSPIVAEATKMMTMMKGIRI